MPESCTTAPQKLCTRLAHQAQLMATTLLRISAEHLGAASKLGVRAEGLSGRAQSPHLASRKRRVPKQLQVGTDEASDSAAFSVSLLHWHENRYLADEVLQSRSSILEPVYSVSRTYELVVVCQMEARARTGGHRLYPARCSAVVDPAGPEMRASACTYSAPAKTVQAQSKRTSCEQTTRVAPSWPLHSSSPSEEHGDSPRSMNAET